METDVQWMILTIYVWIEREKERMHTTPGGHAYEARGHGAEGGAASTCRCGRLPAGERARRLPPHNWAARALAEVYNRHDNRLRRCEGLRSLASRLQPSWKFRRLYACAAHRFGQVDPAADKFRTDLDKFGQSLGQICPISPEF